MELIINTSGSTDTPKTVHHDEHSVRKMLNRSITELGLSSKDTVLNIFPSNVIAYYAITAMPAMTVGATLVSMPWDLYRYIDYVHEYKPTVISLVPPQIKSLMGTKKWRNADFSSVRYCVTGSQLVEEKCINGLLEKGVTTVGNWYGSTEYPPPIFVGHNTPKFTLQAKSQDYDLEFRGRINEAELYVDGQPSGDVFNLGTSEFAYRKNQGELKPSWKS